MSPLRPPQTVRLMIKFYTGDWHTMAKLTIFAHELELPRI